MQIKLWVAIVQESLFIDIVLTVSGTGTEVSWVFFNIRIQSRRIGLHNERYFRKLEDFKENLLPNTSGARELIWLKIQSTPDNSNLQGKLEKV